MSFIDTLRSALPRCYTIDGDLKAGGEGSVFMGRYGNEPAAIKVFKPNSDPKRREREIDCLRRVSCETLVKVIGADDVSIGGIDHVVVAYELHTGGDLTDLIMPDAGRTESQELLQIANDISLAIAALWQHRIVHRDIKPANVVRSNSGGFILVDVGLARHIDRSDLTAVGFAAGTPGYMSPEQARGRRSLTNKSDVFSLGVTLYELAARQHPFRHDQDQIGRVAAAPLKFHRSDLPDSICRLIDAMLSIRPADRPANVTEIIHGIWS